MILQFKLTMPNRGSWDGKWSGDDDNYVMERNIIAHKAKKLLEKGNYRYNWSDGWSANIEVRRITGLSKVERTSDGFCGYGWMVDSIIEHGEIRNSTTK